MEPAFVVHLVDEVRKRVDEFAQQSQKYRETLAEHGLRGSMGRRGVP